MRVLVVDDDDDTVEIFAEFLRLWGHDVRSVQVADLAVAVALELVPDVVLLDLSMPVLDGCEVARRMRAHTSLQTTLLVAVTGHGLQEDVERAYAAGFDIHLLKPVDPQRLRTLIEAGRPAARGELRSAAAPSSPPPAN